MSSRQKTRRKIDSKVEMNIPDGLCHTIILRSSAIALCSIVISDDSSDF